MRNKILISVVIPVYNKAPYLEKCVKSVLNQTLGDVEILLINDGSTDGSLEICQDLADTDNRIVFIDQNNQGASAARNRGLERIKGEWIYFLDADDYLETDTFEILIDYSLKVPKTDIIHFGIRAIQDQVILREKFPGITTHTDNLEDFLHCLELRPVSCCLYLIKTSVIKDHRMRFDISQETGEDKLFIYEVFMHSKYFLILDKIFYNQVLSPHSLSRSPLTKKKVLSNLKSLSKLIQKAEQLNKVNPMQQDLNRGLRSFFGALLHYNQNSNTDKEIQENFKIFYTNNKDVIKSPLAKLGYYNLDYVMVAYRIYHLILRMTKLRST